MVHIKDMRVIFLVKLRVGLLPCVLQMHFQWQLLRANKCLLTIQCLPERCFAHYQYLQCVAKSNPLKLLAIKQTRHLRKVQMRKISYVNSKRKNCM